MQVAVHKPGEPAALRAWRDALRPRGSIPPWNQFPDPPRSMVRAQLAIDQGHICCYCDGTIARGNFHIEHFRPREFYERLTYRWTNLLGSCQTSRTAPVEGAIIETQLHCGDAKGSWFEEDVTVSPLEPRLESLFRYTLRGKVSPARPCEPAKPPSKQRLTSSISTLPCSLRAENESLGRRARTRPA